MWLRLIVGIGIIVAVATAFLKWPAFDRLRTPETRRAIPEISMPLVPATHPVKKIEEKITKIKETPAPSAESTQGQLNTIKQALDTIAKSIKNVTEEIPSSQVPKTRLSQDELHRIAAQSVVNLFCQEENGATAVATGILIHSNGTILTNAHITDNANKDQECTVRAGSPAAPFAVAKLFFTPPAFSATTSIAAKAKWDMALWKIVRSSSAIPLPETFEALAIDFTHDFFSQEALATFSYPAELLSKEVILSSLYLVFSETNVEAVDEIFIQSLAGLGSQQGSSGGALLDPTSGKFVGLIFAVDRETEINKRRLFALRASRIDEIMKQETGKTLEDYLSAQP